MGRTGVGELAGLYLIQLLLELQRLLCGRLFELVILLPGLRELSSQLCQILGVLRGQAAPRMQTSMDAVSAIRLESARPLTGVG